MTTTLSCHLYDISLVVGMMFLSPPTWGCLDISNEFDLVTMLLLSLPTKGCIFVSDDIDQVGMLLLLLSSARNVSTASSMKLA